MALALLIFFYIHKGIYIYEDITRASVLAREGDRFTTASYQPCDGTYMSTLVEGTHMRTPVIGVNAATACT